VIIFTGAKAHESAASYVPVDGDAWIFTCFFSDWLVREKLGSYPRPSATGCGFKY
jgi:hypothetical protein